jgi:hypothetical protein
MKIIKRTYDPQWNDEHVCGFCTDDIEIEASVRTDLTGVSLTLPNNMPILNGEDESVFVNLDVEGIDAVVDALILAKLYILTEQEK